MAPQTRTDFPRKSPQRRECHPSGEGTLSDRAPGSPGRPAFHISVGSAEGRSWKSSPSVIFTVGLVLAPPGHPGPCTVATIWTGAVARRSAPTCCPSPQASLLSCVHRVWCPGGGTLGVVGRARTWSTMSLTLSTLPRPMECMLGGVWTKAHRSSLDPLPHPTPSFFLQQIFIMHPLHPISVTECSGHILRGPLPALPLLKHTEPVICFEPYGHCRGTWWSLP